MPVSIPILMFHSVDNLDSPLSFPPELFRSGLAWLRKQGFQSLTVTEASQCLRGAATAPDGAFAISFDDGYRSVWEAALPVLRDLGFSATLYINGSCSAPQLSPMEGRQRLAWDEIAACLEHGFEIGAHSLTHPDLRRLSVRDLEDEVAGSCAAIEKRLGSPVSSFAYPYGYCNRAVRDVVSRQYQCACSTSLALATPQCDVYALPRLEMRYFHCPRTFRLLASSWLRGYLHARRIPRAIRQALVEGREV